MTSLAKGTPEYEAIFGSFVPTAFDSGGLTYADLTNAFLDPSTAALFSSPDVMNANQSRSIRQGMQLCLRQMAVDFAGTAPPNIPSALLDGVSSLMNSDEIGAAQISAAEVAQIFSTRPSNGPVGTVGAVLGVGLAAVGVAVPVVGWIGSAIVLLATGLYKIIHGHQAKLDKERADHRALLYTTFPPLQVADAKADDKLVDQVVLPTVRKRDWTTVFLPRFAGDWKGVEREGGYAFAQGEPKDKDDEFGAYEAWKPVDNCLGVLPGSDQVTSVVQVSLTHDPAVADSSAFIAFTKGVGPDPRSASNAWRRVQDTGIYYQATGRVAFGLWSLALRRGSPYKYCLDAIRMHEAWRDWADSGLRYIREVCYPWMRENRRGDGTIVPDANYEGYYGTGVYHAVGAWAGYVSGGTNQHPNYVLEPRPYGVPGPYMQSARPRCYGDPDSKLIASIRSGSWLPVQSADSWPDNLMGSRYYRGGNGVAGVNTGSPIKSVLDDLQLRQRADLGHSLVSAYVTAGDAAFVGSPKLRDFLYTVRARLLSSEDRFWVELADVVADEPGVPGLAKTGTWREQLLAAGVPPVPRAGVRVVRLARGIPVPPANPPLIPGPGNPWQPGDGIRRNQARRDAATTGGGFGLILGAGAGLVGAGLLAAHLLRQRPRRSFSGPARR